MAPSSPGDAERVGKSGLNRTPASCSVPEPGDAEQGSAHLEPPTSVGLVVAPEVLFLVSLPLCPTSQPRALETI